MQAARYKVIEHLPGVVAAVQDHDVSGTQGVEMRPCCLAFVVMRDQVEVHRHPGAQPVQATHQACG